MNEETFDFPGALAAYKRGELDERETTRLFQYLVDEGLVWSLSGRYGRNPSGQRADEKPSMSWHHHFLPIPGVRPD